MKIRNPHGYETCAYSLKRNAFTGEIIRCRGLFKQTARCVWAVDVAAVMGEAGWLVRELQCTETICWGNGDTEYYIIYEKEGENEQLF